MPFKLVKEIGKKITKIGGKEILFGATAAGILSEGLADNDNMIITLKILLQLIT